MAFPSGLWKDGQLACRARLWMTDSSTGSRTDPVSVEAGTLRFRSSWMPRARGTYNVTVAVSDGFAASFQNYSVKVANKAPRITSVPPVNARTDALYTYNVTAEDDNHDSLTFSLLNNIVGMGIDAANGSIRWTPEYVNDYDVAVRVSDGIAFADQNFTVKVAQGNRNPKFVSNPVVTAFVGVRYEYRAVARDEDLDVLVFFLDGAPDGMTVGRESGNVNWTPLASGNFTVRLKVSDGRGGEVIQEFSIKVLDRVNPKVEILSIAEGQKMKGKFTLTGKAVKGTLEVVKVQARVDSGEWTDAAGNTSWTFILDTSKLSNGKHTIQVKAYDGVGYSETVNRTVTVDNQKNGGGFIPGFDGMALIAIMGLVICLTSRRRTRWFVR